MHEMVTECYEEHCSRVQKEYFEIRIMTTKLRHKREEMQDKVEENSRK